MIQWFMPKEEKDKDKKFKTVTEEVVEAPKEEKPGIAVTETDNISSEILPKQNKRIFLKFFLITFFGTLLALIVAGGLYVYLTGVKTKSLIQRPTPVPTATETTLPEATATPSANVDVSTYKVSVLNGNGGIGVATAAKNIIEKVGFKVTSVGNADSFDFTDTLIQVKSTVSPDAVAKLKDALSSNYSVAMGDELSAQSSFDVVISVGSK